MHQPVRDNAEVIADHIEQLMRGFPENVRCRALTLATASLVFEIAERDEIDEDSVNAVLSSYYDLVVEEVVDRLNG